MFSSQAVRQSYRRKVEERIERFRADDSLRTHVFVQFRRLWLAVAGPPMTLKRHDDGGELDE